MLSPLPINFLRHHVTIAHRHLPPPSYLGHFSLVSRGAQQIRSTAHQHDLVNGMSGRRLKFYLGAMKNCNLPVVFAVGFSSSVLGLSSLPKPRSTAAQIVVGQPAVRRPRRAVSLFALGYGNIHFEG